MLPQIAHWLRTFCNNGDVMRLVLGLTAFFIPTFANAQLVEAYNPPRANCCLVATAQALANQLQDWNQLGRFHADNERLKALPVEPGRVVFMGDSITDSWKLGQYFPGKPYVNRGISGQTTAQMVVRMMEDVINLKPAALMIFAGTNDIAGNNGPQTFDQVTGNFQMMSELAGLHGIRVIVCSVTPVSDYGPRPMTTGRPPADILRLNSWLKEYALKTNAVYADFFAAVVDEKGWMKDGISRDGLHPNEKGYELMAPVMAAAIEKALGQ